MNIIKTSLKKGKDRRIVLFCCFQLYWCMSSTPSPEEVKKLLSSSATQEQTNHELVLDSIYPDWSHHIDTNYIHETSKVLLQNMMVFTQQDYNNITTDSIFKFNYKGPFDTEKKTLYKKLAIDWKKQELERLRAWGNLEIVKWELQYTSDILAELYKHPRIENDEVKLDNILHHETNCLAKWILCHTYLRELGIKHSAAILPEHFAIIVQIWGKDYYMDPTNSNILKEIDLEKAPKAWVYSHIAKLYNTKNDNLNQVLEWEIEKSLLAAALWNKWCHYMKVWKYENSLKLLNKAIELLPNSSEAYTNRGAAYRKLKEYDKAIADFDQAIVLNPNNFYTYFVKWDTHGRKWEYDKLIKNRNKAKELNPERTKKIESNQAYIDYKRLGQ